MKWRILIGTLSVAATIAILGWMALGERDRMTSFTEAYHARQIETGGALFESSCRSCHGPQGQGLDGVAPAINAADLFNGARLAAVGYAGAVEDYVRGVIAAGRPVPTAGTNYPNRMPTWSQRYGGPLRDDQVDALVAFIMNWEATALAGGAPTPTVAGPGVGTDITISLPQGDAEAGRALAESLGCAGCHLLSAVGPAWLPATGVPGIGERAETAFGASDYTGQAASAEQYLVESIVRPGDYVVASYPAGVMPANYGDRLTADDLANLLAYLSSLR